MKKIQLILLVLTISTVLSAKEYHVAKTGNNNNTGTKEAPLLTIQAAADKAMPGDFITVHAGIYREHITPQRGGSSDSKRIVYRAAEREKVEIKGSEIIDNWKLFTGNVWKVTIPNQFFGDYNPYVDLIKGDWFTRLGRDHHTGEVFLNNKSLWEAELLEKVLNPKPAKEKFDPEGSVYTWFCESDKENTYIYANFQGKNPNQELVEINVRNTCFYPDTTNINYISIKGFHLSQAATQWAPPTAEQVGLIGTNWSKGWLIENNVIRNSKCSGITLGKHGDKYDNTSQNSAEGYVKTIDRALERGWSKKNIGSHIVRNNSISDCEQTGICGSMGGVFSILENNDIYNIWTKRQFKGAEIGGIKIHASNDMLIRNNRLYNCGRGLWLDWMAQGTIVTGNLLYQNDQDDLFVEVNHGPFLIENNILLSALAIRDWSEGGAYAHNLIAGRIEPRPQGRLTPYQKPHSTELAGLEKTKCGDNRYYNNIFVGDEKWKGNRQAGLHVFEKIELPIFTNGNVYLNGAVVFPEEANSVENQDNPNLKVSEENGDLYLTLILDKSILKLKNKLVTTEMLGKAKIPQQGYTNPDGSPITVDTDFLGQQRSKKNPTAGPFEKVEKEKQLIKVWSN